jgi:4-amino-4-deoxychorismate lyase
VTSRAIVATLDGEIIGENELLVPPDDAGVLRGDGVFETTLVVDGVPRDLSEHLARLARSAAALEIDLPSPESWERGVHAVIGASTRTGELVVRLVCTRGSESGGRFGVGRPTPYVLGSPLPPAIPEERRNGIRVLLLNRGFAGSEVAGLPWLLAGAKTLSYAVNMAAKRYAKRQGADDVIFVGTDGCLLEGPTSTVVIARRRTLVTPPGAGILDGVTAQRLFRAAQAAGWTTEVSSLGPADLATADGCWLLSGVRLLAPVTSVDGNALIRGSASEELAELLEVPRCRA